MKLSDGRVVPDLVIDRYIFRALDGGLLAKKEKEAILKRIGKE
jgi:hypothetical protein